MRGAWWILMVCIQEMLPYVVASAVLLGVFLWLA